MDRRMYTIQSCIMCFFLGMFPHIFHIYSCNEIPRSGPTCVSNHASVEDGSDLSNFFCLPALHNVQYRERRPQRGDT